MLPSMFFRWWRKSVIYWGRCGFSLTRLMYCDAQLNRCWHHPRYWPDTPLGTFPKTTGFQLYFRYPPESEPIENVCKVEAKLGVDQVGNSSQLPIGAKCDCRCIVQHRIMLYFVWVVFCLKLTDFCTMAKYLWIMKHPLMQSSVGKFVSTCRAWKFRGTVDSKE